MGFNKDIYAFDDCSILKLSEIRIPMAHHIFFDNNILTANNHSKLKTTINKLDKHNISKFRFVPSENIESNIIKVANQILKGYNIQMLGNTFKIEIIEQLEEFNKKIHKDFNEILKEDNIKRIKDIFINNERELKKEKNIPEEDDLKIIAGYLKYKCEGNKIFITEDEHFWRYDDIILNNFKIHVVKEWECHLIVV